MRRFCLLVFIISILAVGLAAAASSPAIQARVYYSTKAGWLRLQNMSLDQVWLGDGYVEIVTDQSELDQIIALGYKTEIVHADLTAFFQSRMPEKNMGAYKSLDEINQAVDDMIAAYPDIVSAKVSIGTTLEGRDMWAVKISDNPNVDEDEPELFYSAAIHAREVITPEILLYFMNHLTQQYGIDPEATDLVNNREMWFVLVNNPDGYYYNEVIAPGGGGMWRKNRRNNGDGSFGVDLNRNFGYMWGYDDEGSSPIPSDPTYRGSAAFSEPESQNLRDFIAAHDFVLTIYYHSYSNLIIWPWSYDRLYCPDEDLYAEMGDSAAAMNGYAPGPGWILYVVNGGSDDWGYGEQSLKDKNFSLTLEAGSYDDNFWPPASRINDLITENLEPNLFFARIADSIYNLKPPAAPVLSLPDTVNMNAYDVTWSHNDTLNPASLYELVEMTGYQVIEDQAGSFDDWLNAGFSLSTDIYTSGPTSFYSGMGDNMIRYFQSLEPYAVQPGDTLKFQIYYDIETDWDYAYVEVSIDGEAFAPIAGNLTTETNPYGNNRGHGITGSSDDAWVSGLFDLSAFVGQEILFRFSYYTDESVTMFGVYFDDIYPHGVFASSVSYFPVADTLYTMTAKPQGEYSYKVRARDAQRQYSVYSATATTYATQYYACGDANGDGSPDVADAVYIINYVFKSGPPPDPSASGDANGDGDVNIADGVYLINYVFKSGPEPICP